MILVFINPAFVLTTGYCSLLRRQQEMCLKVWCLNAISFSIQVKISPTCSFFVSLLFSQRNIELISVLITSDLYVHKASKHAQPFLSVFLISLNQETHRGRYRKFRKRGQKNSSYPQWLGYLSRFNNTTRIKNGWTILRKIGKKGGGGGGSHIGPLLNPQEHWLCRNIKTVITDKRT